MSANDRENQLVVLEETLRHGDSSDIDELLIVLRLEQYYREYLLNALQRGRWRSAEVPFDKLRRAAMRRAHREDQVRPHEKEILAPGEDYSKNGESVGRGRSMDYFSFILKADVYRDTLTGVWKVGGLGDRMHDAGGPPSRAALIMRMPRQVVVSVRDPGAVDDRQVIKWESVKRLAKLDDWDRKVLDYVLAGVGEKAAMALEVYEADKRAVRSAFARFRRTGIKKIRIALEKR
jgi:hypothetical protein